MYSMYSMTTPAIILRVLLALVVGYIALKRHRDPIFWGLFGFVLPPIALLVIWLADDGSQPIITTATNVEDNAYQASLAAGNEHNIAIQDARAARERYNALPERRK